MKKYFLAFLALSQFCMAQNWNAFNYAYRYNYAFDNSNIVSHVMFADSFKINGQDTLLFLNRIGIPCIGTCLTTTVTVPSGKSYFVNNIPQVLQRSILKRANGWVRFLDTANFNLRPNLTLNQTWLFDTLSNVNAQLTALSTRNVFGSTDSVRVYLVGASDTIVLSKNHGLLVFPEPYNKNKFYRLKGIERNHFYDSTAVAGYKVPNAWDFYNYQVGDVMCYSQTGYDKMVLIPEYFDAQEQITITSKVVSANGYSYGVDTYTTATKYTSLYGIRVQYVNTYNSTTLFCGTTNTIYAPENNIYPGAVFRGQTPILGRNFKPGNLGRNIGHFGLDANGRFCKFVGSSNLSGLPTYSDNSVISDVAGTNGRVMERMAFSSSVHYLPTFGIVSCKTSAEEGFCDTRLNCFARNGVSIFGPKIVGINETTEEHVVSVFPNPNSGQFFIQGAENAEVAIFDVIGNKVCQVETDSFGKCAAPQLCSGTYFLRVTSRDGKTVRSKMVVIQ